MNSSASCILAFLPNLLSYNRKLPPVSNPIPLPEYSYLSGSAFLVNLTTPNKELPNRKTLPTLNGHIFIS